MGRLLTLLLGVVALAAASWLFRYEVIHTDAGFMVLDRWTASATYCTHPMADATNRLSHCTTPLSLVTAIKGRAE